MSQQPTLDRLAIQAELQEFKKVLEQLAERLTKAEVELGVLRTGCETMFHTLELNGFFVGGEPAKVVPGSNPGPEPKEFWDPSKIKWQSAEGNKGPYERSEDVNSADFKALLKTLQEHKGKMTKDGYFMWVFANGTTIGRKKRKQS